MTAETADPVPRPHNAGSYGRRTQSWTRSPWGPNTAVEVDSETILNRSREQARNNGFIDQAIAERVANEIGRHVRVLFRSNDEKFQEQMTEAWSHFIDECDAYGVLNLYGILAQVATGRTRDGEQFIRLRPRRKDSGLAIPLQLQALEPEHFPIHETRSLNNGNRVRNAIEYNKRGQRVAYWAYPNHPGDYSFQFEPKLLKRIPAGLIIHTFNPTRAGQNRGLSEISPALLPAWVYSDYTDSERERKRQRAKITGSLERDPILGQEGDYRFDPMTGIEYEHDTYNQPITEFETGTLFQALPGESLNWYGGDDSGAGYADFQRQQQLEISAGTGVPFERVTGDWSKMTDRMWRAVAASFDRKSDMRLWNLTIHQVLSRVKNAAVELAWLSGRVEAPNFTDPAANRDYKRVDYIPDARPYMHALQDVQAAALRIAEGLSTRESEAARSGTDIETIDNANVKDNARRKKDNLRYGADVKTVIAGHGEDLYGPPRDRPAKTEGTGEGDDNDEKDKQDDDE